MDDMVRAGMRFARRQCSRRVFSEGADPVLSPPSPGASGHLRTAKWQRVCDVPCPYALPSAHMAQAVLPASRGQTCINATEWKSIFPCCARACACCIDVQLVWCMKISCVFLQRRLYLRDPESWQEGSTSRSAYPTKYFMCCISPNHVIEYLATIG